MRKTSWAAMNEAKTILVVEDEPVTRTIIERYLSQADFRVLSTGSGREALDLLRAHRSVDWLFTDIALSGAVDGWAVGAAFKLRHPARPVVYASAFSEGSQERGSDAIYIAKPYSPRDVVAIFWDLSQGRANLAIPAARSPDEPSAPVVQEPAASPGDLRIMKRQRSMLRGTIVFNNRFSTMDCVVRDISQSGARLKLAGEGTLPQVFELNLPLKSRRHQAEMVWRRGEECGVRFIA